MDTAYAHDPLACAFSTEGRFHHGGQPAIYTSMTMKGAGIAIQRYLGENDPERVIIPLNVKLKAVLDLRVPSPFLNDPQEASRVWHNIREQGAQAPTWSISDRARELGADAVLYHSRSQPKYSHLTIVDPKPWINIHHEGPNLNWP